MATPKLTEREQQIDALRKAGCSVKYIAAKLKVTPSCIRQTLINAAVKSIASKPFVLVTVSGGVASVFPPKEVDYDVIDWDNWHDTEPTRNDIRELHEIAMRITDAKTRKAIQDEIEELEGEGLAEDEP